MAVTCTGEGRVLRAAISGEVDHHLSLIHI